MKFRPVLYPFLIGVYPILWLGAVNLYEVLPYLLVVPIVVVLVATALVWGGLALLLRDPHRAGLIATLGLVLFSTVEWSSQALDGFLTALSVHWVYRDVHVPTTAVVVLQVGLTLLLAYLAWKRVRSPRQWTRVLNVFALALVALPTVKVVRQYIANRNAAVPLVAPFPGLKAPERPPDIYYIILDGFARGDVLSELFKYDLEPFLTRLEQKGFYVARHSTSNYCQTPLSLLSSLNGVYLDGYAKAENSTYPDMVHLRKNAVIRTLQPFGYQFVTFASGFDYTDHTEADRYLSPTFPLPQFHRLLIETTPAWRLLPNPGESDSYTLTRLRTEYLFNTLPEVAKDRAPTFTFAHVLSPHPPFVFGSDGEDVSPHHIVYFLNDGSEYRRYYGDAASYVAGYRHQAEYLVKRVEQSIDRLLAESPEPPIIILQSDHGSGLGLDMGSAELTDHHERMSILNAYYFPGGRQAGLHDAITPVNSFRVVFNNYFGGRLELLPEENYYSTWGRPLEFIRVTDQARRPAKAPTDDE